MAVRVAINGFGRIGRLVLRAALEHNLHRGALPVKLWYSGIFCNWSSSISSSVSIKGNS